MFTTAIYRVAANFPPAMLLLCALLLSLSACESKPKQKAVVSQIPLATAIPLAEITTHYGEILQAHVRDGLVDYAALRQRQDDLNSLITKFSYVSEASFAAWSEAEQIAFLINAYNALTLKVIVDHYPIEPGLLTSLAHPKNSIRQISGAWDSITHSLLGQQTTLDYIEHETLRKNYRKPGIHMALVCAAMSCPKLRSEPYVGERLDAQLSDQAKDFLNSSSTFRIDRDKKKIYLSKIFDWFADDFIPVYENKASFTRLTSSSYSYKEKAVLAYISEHLEDADAAFIAEHQPEIEYLDYDWSLNERVSEQ